MRLAFGDYVLDGARRELRRGSEPVAIEPQVFDVLLYLVQNRERLVTKDDLIAAVWKGRIVSESTLTSRITAARKAVGDSGAQQSLIKTYARKGFRFVGDIKIDRESDGAAASPERSTTTIEKPLLRVASDAFGDQIVASPSSGIAIKWDGKPSVAVLPFNNLSGDPEQEYFSDGITDDIITALSKYRSLRVIARNSSFAVARAGGDVRQVGMTIGAEYVVAGSVRRFGERLRVAVQLTETESGGCLWAERYDRDLKELFVLQDEITTAIAARVEPEIGAAERRRVERKAIPSLHAWDFFRLGTKHFYKATAADNLEAQRLFRRAIELDPSVAEAYGFLAYAIVLDMVYFDADPNEGRLNEAREFGRKGVALDDQNSLTRFMYGRTLLAQRAYGDALAELEAAVELNPYLAVTYCGLGDSLAYEGRISEAIPYFQKAIDLSPFDPLRWAFYSYRALAHLFGREFELALEWAFKATRVPNAHYWAFAHRVSALGHMQRGKDFRTAVGELFERKPDFSASFARKRLFYVKNPLQLELYVEGLRKAGVPQ
jgi:TolB-like protein/DNA-binding winged helix-turn-helix (wHTH) protein